MSDYTYKLTVANLHYFNILLNDSNLDKDLASMIEKLSKEMQEQVTDFYNNSRVKKSKVLSFDPLSLTELELIKMSYLNLKLLEPNYEEDKEMLENLISYINKTLKMTVYNNVKGR